MSKGKKRFWSDEEKIEICTQSRIEGVSVAQVARRYAVNANLIHNWMRDPRFSSGDDDTDIVEATFLPVELEGISAAPEEVPRLPANPSGTVLSATRVDLTLSDGRRVLIEGPTSLDSVQSLVQGLMA